MDGIFISYRRDDSAGYAGRLYDRLAGHYGAERVFMDVEGIEPGADFVEAIEAAVSSCRVLIVIIGNEWTNASDAAGRRRLNDPNDFIRLETGAALQRGIRVVPVLVEGAVMPHVDELPEEIKSLARRQAIEISHKQWEASTGELIRTLEGILATTGTSATATKTVRPKAATGAGSTAAQSPAGNRPQDTVGKRPWALPLAVAVVAVVGGGLWFGLGQRGADSPAAPPPPVVAEIKPEATPKPEPKREHEPKSKSETAALPQTSSPSAPNLKPESSSTRPEGAGVAVTTAPVPKPTPVSAPEPVPAPVTEPPPANPPVIRSFKTESMPAGARLCYRVSNADSLTLSPRPGELEKLDQDCVSVDVETLTTFTLTARKADKVVRKTLAVAPKPRVVATPATGLSGVTSDAVEPAAVEPLRTAASALPRKGERWIYRSSGKWPTSPKRQLEIVVQSVADGVVTEALRVIEPASASINEERRSRGKQPDFVSWSGIGIEFSPYFGAFVDLASQGALSNLQTPDLDTQWRQWFSRVKVLGQESVSVPAGTFNAFKVEVWSNRHPTGSQIEAGVEPVLVHYLIWYDAQAKRYVKMLRRITTAANTESERDIFELVSHKLP